MRKNCVVWSTFLWYWSNLEADLGNITIRSFSCLPIVLFSWWCKRREKRFAVHFFHNCKLFSNRGTWLSKEMLVSVLSFFSVLQPFCKCCRWWFLRVSDKPGFNVLHNRNSEFFLFLLHSIPCDLVIAYKSSYTYWWKELYDIHHPSYKYTWAVCWIRLNCH